MCEKCNDTEYLITIDDDGYVYAKQCECGVKKDFERRLRRSGLLDLFQEFRFENYQVKGKWQEIIKHKALDYVENGVKNGEWFFIGGQVGAGKTMICTAIVGKLIELGYEAHYMQFRQEIMELKMGMEDFAEHHRKLNYLKTVKVLYIDDLFKGSKIPTEADVRLVFDLLNYRYNNKSLITLISTEKNIQDIISIDEAIGSRIYQKSREYMINLAQNKELNQRLKKEN